ncbi:MAG: hypothetical protein K6E64_03725 [Lachnospiraceae bacterium]|nr:hypothetical protein [Lachnospiraceae bacterium]
MKTFRKCNKCGAFLKKETSKSLRNEYPFVCPRCDENMFYIESIKVDRNKHRRGKK